ncbi:hypothetical protein F4781DRAFT_438167 [Annulohypoxylon bovei var. microspora]|nr:hypothetical protein F4781DRAFT_438167 [Annulohypoxylon bovei var. microspora]
MSTQSYPLPLLSSATATTAIAIAFTTAASAAAAATAAATAAAAAATAAATAVPVPAPVLLCRRLHLHAHVTPQPLHGPRLGAPHQDILALPLPRGPDPVPPGPVPAPQAAVRGADRAFSEGERPDPQARVRLYQRDCGLPGEVRGAGGRGDAGDQVALERLPVVAEDLGQLRRGPARELCDGPRAALGGRDLLAGLGQLPAGHPHGLQESKGGRLQGDTTRGAMLAAGELSLDVVDELAEDQQDDVQGELVGGSHLLASTPIMPGVPGDLGERVPELEVLADRDAGLRYEEPGQVSQPRDVGLERPLPAPGAADQALLVASGGSQLAVTHEQLRIHDLQDVRGLGVARLLAAQVKPQLVDRADEIRDLLLHIGDLLPHIGDLRGHGGYLLRLRAQARFRGREVPPDGPSFVLGELDLGDAPGIRGALDLRRALDLCRALAVPLGAEQGFSVPHTHSS